MTSILANPTNVDPSRLQIQTRLQRDAPAIQSLADASSTAVGAGTITSSDFLTLLVTELKNQDPTSDQDPNAYIDQLVQVNSLQQLISINQELSNSGSTAATTSVRMTTDPTTPQELKK